MSHTEHIDANILSPLSNFGDLRTVNLTPILQGSFEFTVDNTELNTNTVMAGGTITQSQAMAVLSTSTTTGSSAQLQSKQQARYRAGLGGLLRFTGLFTSGVAGTEQYIGIVDVPGASATFKNGFALGYNGVNLSIARWQNDVLADDVPQSSWEDPLDGTGPSGMTIDPTKLNVFFIGYQYLGGGPISFFVENVKADGTKEFVNFYTIKYPNANTVPSVFNPNFKFTIWNSNGATTSDIITKCASYSYFIEGETEFFEIHQPEFASDLISKAGVTTEEAIFTIRNRSLYAGIDNFIDVVVENIVASVDANSINNLAEIRLVKNATLGGVPVFNDVNTTNSVMEIDLAGTTVTGGKVLIAVPLAGQNDKLIENLVDYKIVLNPGDTITLSGLSTNNATIEGGLLWKELF